MLRRRLLGEKGESFKYITGNLYCPSGVDFNNYTLSGYPGCGVHATFMLHDDTSWANIANNRVTNNGWDLHITSSEYGHILEWTEIYNGLTANFQWWDFGALVSNTWYELDLYVNSSGAFASINGSDHVQQTVSSRQRSRSSTARNIVFGGDNIRFRGELSVWGSQYSNPYTGCWAGWQLDDATVGSVVNLTSESYTLTSDNIVQRGRE